MKTTSIFSIALLALIIISCKKDYTCECTTTNATGNNTGSSSSTSVITKTKESNAKKICSSSDDVFTYSAGSSTAVYTSVKTCNVK